MVPWIQVYSNLIKHPKTSDLADRLKISSSCTSPNAVAAGMLVSLWLWAAQNAPDGDLSLCGNRAIAEAAEWKKKPDAFVDALVQCRWLDEDRKLHDWDEYAALLQNCLENQRKKTRERVQRYRDRQRENVTDEMPECNAVPDSGCNVTGRYISTPVTLCNASTRPNLTIPNQTNIFCGGGGDSAREAADETLLAKIGLRPQEYPFVSRDTVEDVIRTARNLFTKYGLGVPKPWDCRGVFTAWPQRQLLDYAFEQSALARKPGNWGYIAGVLETCSLRGVETEEQARRWDRNRPDKEG